MRFWTYDCDGCIGFFLKEKSKKNKEVDVHSRKFSLKKKESDTAHDLHILDLSLSIFSLCMWILNLAILFLEA